MILELTVLPFAVWYMYALSIVATELPAMKWTFEATTFNDSSCSQVGAHMRTIGIDHVCSAIIPSEDGQIFPCSRRQINKLLPKFS